MAAIAQVQSNHGVASAASVAVTLGSATNTGNLVLAEISLPAGASVSSVSDNNFGRWIQVGFSYCDNGGAELWMNRGCHGGTPTVTVNFTAARYAAAADTDVPTMAVIAGAIVAAAIACVKLTSAATITTTAFAK